MGTRFVSLFSGSMGLDLGLEQAGFEVAVCNEIDGPAIETIRRNRPTLPVVSQSITEVDRKILETEAGSSLPDIDLIAGGPPCQSFSVYGKRLGS